MLASAAFGLYPYVLPSNKEPELGLTTYNTIVGDHGLKVGPRWWIPGMLLTVVYIVYAHRKFSGKVVLDGEEY